MFSLAHISDLHFAKFSYNPLQFFSKRWVGNFNFLLNRRNTFSHLDLPRFILFLKQKKFQKILITGDFSTTGRDPEFLAAKHFCKALEKENLPVICIPGNHDFYTKANEKKKSFYQFLENPSPSFFSLKKEGIEAAPLWKDFWYIALDTCKATSLLSAEGFFSETLEKKMEELFSLLPKKAKILLLNHFPLFCNDGKKKSLVRSKFLRKVLEKNPSVLLYLCGHTHRSSLADLRERGLPILLDAGSLTYQKRSSFNAIHLFEQKVDVEIFQKKSAWEVVRKERFTF